MVTVQICDFYIEPSVPSNWPVKILHLRNFDTILHTKRVDIFKKFIPSTILAHLLQLNLCEKNEVYGINNILVPLLQSMTQICRVPKYSTHQVCHENKFK